MQHKGSTLLRFLRENFLIIALCLIHAHTATAMKKPIDLDEDGIIYCMKTSHDRKTTYVILNDDIPIALPTTLGKTVIYKPKDIFIGHTNHSTLYYYYLHYDNAYIIIAYNHKTRSKKTLRYRQEKLKKACLNHKETFVIAITHPSSAYNKVKLIRISDSIGISFSKKNDSFTCATCSPKEDALILGTEQGILTVITYDAKTLTHKKTSLKSMRGQITCIQYNPRVTRIAVGSINGEIRLYAPKVSKPLGIFKNHTSMGHTKRIKCLQFTLDGKYLVSGSKDQENAIRIWDIANQSCIKTICLNKSELTNIYSARYIKHMCLTQHDKYILLHTSTESFTKCQKLASYPTPKVCHKKNIPLERLLFLCNYTPIIQIIFLRKE